MRTKHLLEALHQDTDHLIAYFGDARLVRTQVGRLEVHGGTEADHADVWNWAQRFLTPPAAGGGSRTIAAWTGSEASPPGSG